MNYFRAILYREEFSERSLNLTTHALRLNLNNYNLWSFRRRILKNLKYDPQKELCWIEEVIRESPKNFYAWEHRRMVANSNLNYCEAETELNLTENILATDPKNYCVWQHRQWAIHTHKFTNSGLLSSEMKFTGKLIDSDVRNNSAWNQRFFVLKQRGKTDLIFVKNEFSFVVAKVKIAPENESAWNYLRGVLFQFPTVKKIPQYQEFVDYIEKQFYELHVHKSHLIAFLIDYKIETILNLCESSEIIQSQKVFQLCNLMSEKFDMTRKNYWKFVYKLFYFERIKQRDDSLLLTTVDSEGGARQDQSWRQKNCKKVGKHTNLEQIKFADFKQQINDKKGNISKEKFKKHEKSEIAKGIGTDLLFDIMSKYNR